eukprot:COSAG02_NODE_1079_length_14711_cov_86.326512_9_plen_78_part_00
MVAQVLIGKTRAYTESSNCRVEVPRFQYRVDSLTHELGARGRRDAVADVVAVGDCVGGASFVWSPHLLVCKLFRSVR